MPELLNDIKVFLGSTGLASLIEQADWWKYLIMYAIIGVLFYLAIVKKFEPLLLLPISFGMLLANLPGANLMHLDMFFDDYYISFANIGTLFEADGSLIKDLVLPYKDQLKSFLAALQENGITYTLAEGTMTFAEGALSDAKFLELFENSGLKNCVFAFKDNLYVVGDCALRNQLNSFLYYLPSSFTPAFADGVLTFSKDTLTNAEFVNHFNQYLGGFMSVNNTGFHIKLTTMILEVINNGGLVDILYLGVKLGIYPSLIFMGVGAMTDFSPLIANPKSLLMGAGAQFGVFAAFFFALFLGFTPMEAGAIGIIGGADGPTAILVTKELAPKLLGAIAIAAYSYMALVPFIQPPIMKAFTSKKERQIVMGQLRNVSKVEEVVFPIVVTLIVSLILPSATALVGMLMLGNLLRVSGVAERLSKTVQNELMNIVTVMLGVSVGATANAANFLQKETLFIIVLGLCAFGFATIGGTLFGKLMCVLTKGKINPLIGSAGVSAVPMAARVSQMVGQKENPSNFLLMHAMGPNVAGVIGSAVAAGVFIAMFA
jgi:oxaloacetate decarboxylase beta subunit